MRPESVAKVIRPPVIRVKPKHRLARAKWFGVEALWFAVAVLAFFVCSFISCALH